ncbi:MAG: hypothetical protein ACJAUP_001417 [Cellvibrionaceae bacterium]
MSVSGGEYSIGLGNEFTAEPGTIRGWKMISVRQTTASTPDTTVYTALTVGDVTEVYQSTNAAADTSPFSLEDLRVAAVGMQYISDPITIAGINVSTPISISGAEYCINGGSFTNVDCMVINGDTVETASAAEAEAVMVEAILTIGNVDSAYISAAGAVSNNQTVPLRALSSTSLATSTSATLSIGNMSDSFRVTTAGVDMTPANFQFEDLNNIEISTLVTSNSITVMGINIATPLSISNGGYSNNGEPFSSLPGTVNNGDTVRIRLISADTIEATISTRLTRARLPILFLLPLKNVIESQHPFFLLIRRMYLLTP